MKSFTFLLSLVSSTLAWSRSNCLAQTFPKCFGTPKSNGTIADEIALNSPSPNPDESPSQPLSTPQQPGNPSLASNSARRPPLSNQNPNPKSSPNKGHKQPNASPTQTGAPRTPPPVENIRIETQFVIHILDGQNAYLHTFFFTERSYDQKHEIRVKHEGSEVPTANCASASCQVTVKREMEGRFVISVIAKNDDDYVVGNGTTFFYATTSFASDIMIRPRGYGFDKLWSDDSLATDREETIQWKKVKNENSYAVRITGEDPLKGNQEFLVEGLGEPQFKVQLRLKYCVYRIFVVAVDKNDRVVSWAKLDAWSN